MLRSRRPATAGMTGRDSPAPSGTPPAYPAAVRDSPAPSGRSTRPEPTVRDAPCATTLRRCRTTTWARLASGRSRGGLRPGPSRSTTSPPRIRHRPGRSDTLCRDLNRVPTLVRIRPQSSMTALPSPLQVGEPVAHGLDLGGWVSDPVLELADDLHRILGAVRPRGVTGKPLVGHVGIVLEGAQRFDEVDAAPTLAHRQLGAPGGGIQGGRHVHVVGGPSAAVVRPAPGHQQVPHRQVRLGAVEQRPRLVHLERCRHTHPDLQPVRSGLHCRLGAPGLIVASVHPERSSLQRSRRARSTTSSTWCAPAPPSGTMRGRCSSTSTCQSSSRSAAIIAGQT